MAGRKRQYEPETLKIGEKMQLLGKAKKYKDQYLYQFNLRSEAKYKTLVEGAKVFLERIY